MPPCSLAVTRIRSYAKVSTSCASEYLIGLCRNLHHSLPKSSQIPTHIEIALANGRVALNASDVYLEIALTASSRFDTALLEDLVSDHLDRLSREDLQYEWVGQSIE